MESRLALEWTTLLTRRAMNHIATVTSVGETRTRMMLGVSEPGLRRGVIVVGLLPERFGGSDQHPHTEFAKPPCDELRTPYEDAGGLPELSLFSV